MNGVNEPDENGKILNLLDPDAEKQTFGRKSQNWTNLRETDENSILLKKNFFKKLGIKVKHIEHVNNLNQPYLGSRLQTLSTR
ncbi:hypothetical protein Hanom_Chr02g00148651 [Helianthus anomalus]